MILAWIGALFIGVTLGLLGSGGSILTVPVLTYLVGQETKVAIAGSLMIVGIISLFSVIPYARQKLVKWRTVVIFGVPGMAGAVLGAWLAHFVSDALQMLIFSALLLVASYLMFKPVKLGDSEEEHQERAVSKIALDGLLVGAVTGLVGVGGGFLIIPALVLLGGLSMRLAVGTSLVIIAIKSFAGFIGYLSVLEALNLTVDWYIIWMFSIIGIVGGWLGHKISSKVNQEQLKRGFAVFLVLMGAFILYKNLPSLF
ncbi:sulfite exporter TauE/SafE family protein [Thiomicrorhabdus lithotrophica]|uniref:Probable membrane transporter protein n=1 Tax=Thiomicrorhabdus lithotrophica TaxID=2949997 RepID=A0ABY8CA78_9GAMM|nr:sulfite exporter TauE/SafE family protein [Thiomicrorhabdus lithotrophica]WEJ62890.1 sulfite exporter TauE/SafE family protein [Thiomicrorhabdus lithotrophica]